MKKNGFTLIEVLVVITIIGVIGYALADLLSRSYQGSTKTELVGAVKQNGQVVLDLMTKEIRNADRVLCVSNDMGTIGKDTIAIRDKSGGYFRFQVVNNGGIIEDYPNLSALNDTQSSEIDKVCDFKNSPVPYPLNNTKDLIDTSRFLVDMSAFSDNIAIKVNNSPGLKDIIDIKFSLKLKTNGSGFQDQLGGNGTVSFSTSAELR